MFERNNEKLLHIVMMRMEGKSLQQIANYYGCTRQNIEQILSRLCESPKTIMSRRNCIYAGLREWLADKNCSVNSLAKSTGIKQPTLSCYLSGKSQIKIDCIKAILEHTGLTFEQAFCEEQHGETQE